MTTSNAPSTILVTGGAGFIGSHLATRLLQDGHSVVILDDLSNSHASNVPSGATFVQADIADEKALGHVFDQGINAVCHLAAQSSGTLSFADPKKDMHSHVIGTFQLLETCRHYNVNRFLYASSTTIYGEPASLPVKEDALLAPTMYYSTGKQAAEAYVRFYKRFGVEHTIFRMPNVYGPGQNLDNKFQGMISIYLSFLFENKPITVKGGLERFRDFIYVDDVVDAWAAALNTPSSNGQTYNLGTGASRTVGDVLQCLLAAWGEPDYPVIVEEGTPGDQSGMALDVNNIKKDLGFSAKHTLETGLARMVQIEKERHE